MNEKDFQFAQNTLDRVQEEISKVIVGQHDLIKKLLLAICVQGHVLVEGFPGLAKTSVIKLLSKITGSIFSRVQFTPDLLPADITGTLIYQQSDEKYRVHKGPIFANLVLADEINRAPAKVQSALLQAMEERTVTFGKEVHNLPSLFFVMATQNPIEHEGTYELPEAQLDRFMFKLNVNYPSFDEEIQILKKVDQLSLKEVDKVCTLNNLYDIGKLSEDVEVQDSLLQYIVKLVSATRKNEVGIHSYNQNIEFGASPRASIAMLRCARVLALSEKRDAVIPEDIKAVAKDILRHRIILNFDAIANEMPVDYVIDTVLNHVSIPR